MRYTTLPMALGLLLSTGGDALSSSCGDGNHTHSSSEKIVKHIFEKADLDGDGFLSLDEHSAALSKFGTKFSVFDTNKDEKISIEEYMKTFQRFHPSGKQGAST